MTVDPKILQEFVGTWSFRPNDIMKVSIKGDHLLAELSAGENKWQEELFAETRDRWFSTETDDMGRLDFERDSNGRPVRVRRSLYGPVTIGTKD